MKILAVDDRSDDLYLLQKMLEGKGFEVIPATNGKEALEKIKESTPDLVISDILMPKMDGYQLLKEMKSAKKTREVPFVFYTATYTSKKDEKFAYSLGASRFIIKPQEPETFIEIINKAVKDHGEGILTSSKPTIETGEVYLKEYNERLVQKLEDKVTELATANETIDRSRTFLKALLESLRDGMIYVDLHGEIGLTNKKGEELKKEVMEKILPILQTEGPECTCDFDLYVKGCYYDVRCYPLITPEGEYLGATIVLRDITDRRQVQEELKARLEELEKWQRLTVGREIKMIELKKQIKELESDIKTYKAKRQ